MGRVAFALLVVCVLLWGGQARGATVAILRASSAAPELSEALFRLQGELLAVGLAVVIAERPPDHDTRSADARAWFEQLATERGIDAIIDVVGERKPVAVDVWLCERSPRRLRVSRVVLEPGAQDPAATLAIHAIEVLRSSFLARDLAGEQPVRTPPRQAEPRSELSVAPPLVSRFGIAVGAAALVSLDGVGVSVLPLARLDWAVRSWLALQLTGAGLGTRPRLETEAGSVQVAQQFGVFGLCACRAADTGFRPFAALGAGILRTALDGIATPPNVGHEVEHWAFLVHGSVGVTLNVPGRYYATLGLHVQLAEPYVAIHVVDAVVATTGRPDLLLALTAGAWL